MRYTPHRCDDTAEPNKQHRCSKMNGLIGLLRVAFRRLASAEKREQCILQVQADQLLNRQPAVAEAEP